MTTTKTTKPKPPKTRIDHRVTTFAQAVEALGPRTALEGVVCDAAVRMVQIGQHQHTSTGDRIRAASVTGELLRLLADLRKPNGAQQ
jgi:hypothetical protein